MSSKVRIYEVAKQLNLDPKQVVGLFQAIGVADVRNHMSSVEPEAIERVKRHLEKQRTHDVVEERVRFGVVKRRAVAKPGSPALGDVVSTSSLPPSSGSLRALDDAVVMERNGHLSAEPSPVLQTRESLRKKETKKEVLEPLSTPPPSDEERASLLQPIVPVAEPPQLVAEPVRVQVPAPAVELHVQPLPALVAALVERPTDDAAAAAAPVPQPTPVPPQEAPASPKPQPSAVAPAPTIGPLAAVSSVAPAQDVPLGRAGASPKTGVEYWTGRPGVPMPVSTSATTARSASPQPNMPRRIQYDPRAGSAAGSSARRDVRAPGQQPGRPMMGRTPGGAGGRRPIGPLPPKRPPVVSTQEMSAHKKVIRIDSDVTLQTMASRMSLKATELLMKLLSMGMSNVHINTTLDADTAKILASEFGWEVEDVSKSEEQTIAEARGEEEARDAEAVTRRPPVVTVMGHVDHGKTSLLDRIRKANVAGGEAGGITQHIGAYKVETRQGTIVFLDTPGHEAFTQMRARGASVTDVVVLVVAADDGVMPQTKEAIAHAKAAKVPILVAINKVDKPQADVERVKRELVEQGLVPEEWGGDTLFVGVSAVTGEGIDRLLESIQLQSELLELRASAARPASGT
ncbi:MAG TPA: translation initiation factor IF-2 N-terminal domain-containing protein, partial [Polyangiaceae bacterium]|nr:translation initiation factor IF-2 N-terminal domain-containing protein [Polyangiaceae bacterium]